MRMRLPFTACTFVLCCLTGPVFSEVDEVALGKSRAYPAAPTLSQAGQDEFIVWSNSGGYEKFLPYRTVKAGAPTVLPRAHAPAPITYEFQGRPSTLTDYLSRRRVTSLLILKDGVIQHEHYQYDRTDRHRFNSASMGKSVLGLLVGLAIEDGAIRSVDDPIIGYLPQLRGTALERLTVKHLLTMSTGLAWSEGAASGAHYRKMLEIMEKSGGMDVVLGFKDLEVRSPPSSAFLYSSFDSEVLGRALAAALRKNVAAYLEEKIWRPMGAESDAVWYTDRANVERTNCCIGATTRDFGRIGALLANKGQWNGRQIIPQRWIDEMTASHGPHLERVAIDREARMGFGYHIWRIREGQIALRGHRGQVIFVDQKTKTVLVQTAVYGPSQNSMSNFTELDALWEGVVATFNGQGEHRPSPAN